MLRSSLTESFYRVQMIIDLIDGLSPEEHGYFMDRIAPLPEESEAPAKKTRKKRASKLPASTTARLKRGLPQDEHLALQKAQSADDGDLDSPETCVRCPNPIDDNIHHKTTVDGYHEFKSAA